MKSEDVRKILGHVFRIVRQHVSDQKQQAAVLEELGTLLQRHKEPTPQPAWLRALVADVHTMEGGVS